MRSVYKWTLWPNITYGLYKFGIVRFFKSFFRNNIPINQSNLRDHITVYVKFRFTTRVSTSVLFTVNHFPLTLGEVMGRVRFRGTTFSDRNVVPGSTRYVGYRNMFNLAKSW